MFRRPDGTVSVDRHLINDVVEQNGGGGEPFTVVKDRRLSSVIHVTLGACENKVAQTQDNVTTAAEMVRGKVVDAVSDAAEKMTETRAQVTTAAEMVHGKVVDAVSNAAEKMTETGSQISQILKKEDTNPVAPPDGAEPLMKKDA
jgi:hypothetical protein